jgi:hypothetical protein
MAIPDAFDEAPDADALRRALTLSREQRASATRGRFAPHDTAHLLRRCASCNQLSLLLRGAELPWSSLLSPARPTRLDDAVARLRELIASPGRSPDDPTCACTTGGVKRIVAARFHRALLGVGADLVVELVEDRARALRCPYDGPERPLDDVADEALADALGRLLSLAPALRALGLEALAQGAAAYSPEPGQWLVAAAPHALEAALAAARASDRGAVSYDTVYLSPSTAAEPLWRSLGDPVTAALSAGSLRVAMRLDRARWVSLARLWLVRAGHRVEEDADAGRLTAEADGVTSPVELAPVSASVLRLGLTLSEGAAVLADAVNERLSATRRFLDAVSALRPGLRFLVEDGRAVPIFEGGQRGLPLDLTVLPARCPPGSERLAREVRHACEGLAPWVDATRVCRCGAAAHVARRLLPWSVVEGMYRAAPDDGPVIFDVLRAETPVAAVVAAVVCDLHVSVLRRSERDALRLNDAALARRADTARDDEHFHGRVERALDPAGRAAVALVAPWVASAFFDLPLACGLAKSASAEITSTDVTLRAPTPNVLVLHDPACEPATVAAVGLAALGFDGYGPSAQTPFLLTREAPTPSDAIGRFEREDA